jgi:hypothetical protein
MARGRGVGITRWNRDAARVFQARQTIARRRPSEAERPSFRHQLTILTVVTITRAATFSLGGRICRAAHSAGWMQRPQSDLTRTVRRIIRQVCRAWSCDFTTGSTLERSLPSALERGNFDGHGAAGVADVSLDSRLSFFCFRGFFPLFGRCWSLPVHPCVAHAVVRERQFEP